MRLTVRAATFVLMLTLDFPVVAQFPEQYQTGGGSPYPGGSPSGTGIPGISLPRRSKDKKADEKAKQPPLLSLTGVLQQIDDASITIVAKDTRTITAKRSDLTKVFKKGVETNATSLTRGHQVRIEATQDEQGFYHAVAVHVDSEASAQDKAAAEVAAPPSRQRSDDGDERPILRRSPAPGDPVPETDKAEPDADWVRPAPQVTVPDIAYGEDPGRPRQRRGKPPVRKSPASAETAPAAGKPAPPTSPEPQIVASNKPQIVASNKPRFEADPTEAAGPPDDPRIAKAREAVAANTQSLPNYFCQQHIARFASTTHKVDWRPLDVVSATVVYENGRDEYRNLAVNGKPVNKRMEDLGGAWSTGEFGMIAADIFSPATAARFTSGGAARTAGHDAVVYDFEVDREHSHWHIQAPSQSIMAAYKGSVWLERETAEVLRIEMQTYRMPKDFPFDKVESAIDYEYVRLGENRFLLPVHSETLTCVRGTSNCSRNVIDFRNYRKYAGESTITFDK
jgi:hypothetical protein